MDARMKIADASRLVVKVGSSSLTNSGAGCTQNTSMRW